MARGQMGMAAVPGMPVSARRTRKPGARWVVAGAHRLGMLAAGLGALLLAAACSSDAVTDPDPSAFAEPSPETATAPPEVIPPPQPTLPTRQAPSPHAYESLWRAAAAGSLHTAHGQDTAAQPQATGANGTSVSAPGEPAAEAQREPEAAPAVAPDDTLPNPPVEGRQLRMEDYAQLSRYLEGMASWYGPNFHGKPTANGETYNQYGLTAAHPVLPIGTRVLVENLSNGRKVWLRINDRGPYAKGRVLDLSRIAAERLGIIAQGTAPVRITVLKWPETIEPGPGLKAFQQYTVQTAAYPELSSAEELRGRLQARHPQFPFFVDRASNGFYAVAAGPFDDEHEARQVARSIHRSGLSPIVKRYRN